MNKIEIIMGLLLVCVVLQFVFNWNVENPLLLVLSWTQIGLFFSLSSLNKKVLEIKWL